MKSDCPEIEERPGSQEAWRDLPGFPCYQVSTLGRVRSSKSGAWRVLRVTRHSKTGYVAVSLRVDNRYITRSIHRLVALAFIGPAHGKDVNHINGDKEDNRLVNLEYLSRGANHRHAYRTGLREPVGKKLSDQDVTRIAALKGIYTQKDLAHRFGVSRATVSLIHHGKRHQSILCA